MCKKVLLSNNTETGKLGSWPLRFLGIPQIKKGEFKFVPPALALSTSPNQVNIQYVVSYLNLNSLKMGESYLQIQMLILELST